MALNSDWKSFIIIGCCDYQECILTDMSLICYGLTDDVLSVRFLLLKLKLKFNKSDVIDFVAEILKTSLWRCFIKIGPDQGSIIHVLLDSVAFNIFKYPHKIWFVPKSETEIIKLYSFDM